MKESATDHCQLMSVVREIWKRGWYFVRYYWPENEITVSPTMPLRKNVLCPYQWTEPMRKYLNLSKTLYKEPRFS